MSLNITALGAMHALDSVMRSVQLYDEVTVRVESGEGVRVGFDVPVGERNTVTKALELSAPLLIGRRVEVDVIKRIPIGAGLGGSSADAAAVIYALDKIIGYEKFGLNANEVALKVGSDVPFMIKGGAARLIGTGADASSFVDKAEYFGVGIGDGCVSSGEAYAKFDEIYAEPFAPCDNDKLIDCLKRGDFCGAACEFKNALTAPACALNPKIAPNMQALGQFSQVVNLTGSGSFVVAYFNDRALAEAAAKKSGGVFFEFAPRGIEEIL